jgi:hypothetical protein
MISRSIGCLAHRLNILSQLVIESLPILAAALAKPALAELIFSAYCSGCYWRGQYRRCGRKIKGTQKNRDATIRGDTFSVAGELPHCAFLNNRSVCHNLYYAH